MVHKIIEKYIFITNTELIHIIEKFHKVHGRILRFA